MRYKPFQINTISQPARENMIAGLVDAWSPAYRQILSRQMALKTVEHLLTVQSSEFFHENIKILEYDQEIIGATLFLDMQDIGKARQVNILNILGKILKTPEEKNDFMANLDIYTNMFPKLLSTEGVYLSKFVIFDHHQSKGFGAALMENFKEYEIRDRDAYLEVHKENKAAIHIYEKNGFARINSDDKPYYLMKRTQ